MVVPAHTEKLLEKLAESLQVSDTHYQEAEKRYKNLGKWLHDEKSTVRDADPKVYVQGSFRLGTPIRPETDQEHYDLDLVCELNFSKSDLTQSDLKERLGVELKKYAKKYSMTQPENKQRCWTQEYAESAQFHMDTLPAIPDGDMQRDIFEVRGYSTDLTNVAGTAIAITDKGHKNFRKISEDWPHSNPIGYAEWFRSRMQVTFDKMRKMIAEEAFASVEDIPEYRVRTPLQSAIQILKHHRDVMFAENPDDKPASIILTTLAAHAYRQEGTISEALFGILDRMEEHINYKGSVAVIENPTDPAENFADRWQKYPEREPAFWEWLEKAQDDFRSAARAQNVTVAMESLEPRMGQERVEKAAKDAGLRWSKRSSALAGVTGIGVILNPPHRQSPPWEKSTLPGRVSIDRVLVDSSGFRPKAVISDAAPLPKNCQLRFEASTNIPGPYRVYWQVVNTGREAERRRELRGNFEEGVFSRGNLTRKESTLYAGKHSIECFIIKNNELVASSGQFIVNIQ